MLGLLYDWLVGWIRQDSLHLGDKYFKTDVIGVWPEGLGDYYYTKGEKGAVSEQTECTRAQKSVEYNA